MAKPRAQGARGAKGSKGPKGPKGAQAVEAISEEPRVSEEPTGPLGFGSVHGHDEVIARLRLAISEGRVPHAYLFVGPSGVGKATTAVALAQALNCEPQPGQGCGVCTDCHRIRREVHPDLVRVEAEGKSIKIEQVRGLEDRLGQGPHEGQALVILVNEAERFTQAAANALLKSLEEPRPGVCFVLVTAAPNRLPITVRSRCQAVRFGPLPEAVLVSLLVEKCGASSEEARGVARFAEGSMARAMLLLVSADLPLWQTWCDRLARLPPDPQVDVPALVQALLGEVDEPETLLRLLLPRLRDQLLVASGFDEDGRLLTQMDAGSREVEAARRLPPMLAHRRLFSVQTVLGDLEMNVNKHLAFERMVLGLRP